MIRLLRTKRYTVEISLTAQCPMPRSYLRTVGDATVRAIKMLPVATQKRFLKTRKHYRLDVTLLTPKAIQKLNRKYRRKNRPTDVLSFSRFDGPAMPIPEIGDLILCWAVAKKQAKEFGITPRQELEKLVVHGVLHLFGYDHEKNAKEAKKMFRLQDKITSAIRG